MAHAVPWYEEERIVFGSPLVGNRHVTPSSALIDALPYVSRSISF